MEIGGVSDLDEAKEIIGKTVELEFKLPYEDGDTSARDARQLGAEDLLKQAVATPALMNQLANTRQGDNVYFQTYTDVPLAELPQVYAENPDIFDGWATGTVYATLLEGPYAEGVQVIDGATQTVTLE
ncbi:MAG: hypothetical protein H6765_09620 [Candidatus Peribacteria bacterium]|nr:MAG: hypothetical protein H6765_09620 [Candidatus Peribacteria bacterium]